MSVMGTGATSTGKHRLVLGKRWGRPAAMQGVLGLIHKSVAGSETGHLLEMNISQHRVEPYM